MSTVSRTAPIILQLLAKTKQVSVWFALGFRPTRVTANGSGAQTARQTYYPFGGVRTTSGTLPTDYTFTGQKLDSSSGLMYYGARYYDAAIGRFAQPDSIVPNPYNPQSLNRYSYVLNNPLRYTDPTGHYACEDLECNDTEPSSPGPDFYGTGDDDVSDDTPADTDGEQQPEKGSERENGKGANPGGNRKNPDTWDRSRRDLSPRTLAIGGTVQATLGIVAFQGSLVVMFDLDGNAALVWSPAGGVGVGGSAMIGPTVQVTNAENIDTVINADHTFYTGHPLVRVSVGARI